MVKNPRANAGDADLSPGSGRSPKEGNANILAWEIPWTEKPCGLQSIWLQRVRHDLVTKKTKSKLVTWIIINK